MPTQATFEKYGVTSDWSTPHAGLAKVRLWHGLGYSLIIPDMLVTTAAGSAQWYQPLAFFPCMLERDHSDITCRIAVDLSGGCLVQLEFRSSQWIRRLQDGADLFRCTIRGPQDLHALASGTGIVTAGHEVHVDLFHHTANETATLITSSAMLRASQWNFQGTKKLANIEYAYLTSIASIQTGADLKMIAMSSDGVIHLARDGFDPPLFLPQDWRTRFAADLLELPVYRESTANRTVAIPLRVDAAALAVHHLFRHESNAGVYYASCNSMIHRIGVEPGAAIPIRGGALDIASASLKRLGYVVVGDATSLTGLAVPYDEENTSCIMKLEEIKPDSNVLRHWFDHANQDLYSARNVTLQEFE